MNNLTSCEKHEKVVVVYERESSFRYNDCPLCTIEKEKVELESQVDALQKALDASIFRMPTI